MQAGDTAKRERLEGYWTYVGTFQQVTEDTEGIEDVSTFASKFKDLPSESKDAWVTELANPDCTWGMALTDLQKDIMNLTDADWKRVLEEVHEKHPECNLKRKDILNPGDASGRKKITMECLSTGLLACNFTSVKCVGFDHAFYNCLKKNCDTYYFNLRGEEVPNPEGNNNDEDGGKEPAKKRRKRTTPTPTVSPQPVRGAQGGRSSSRTQNKKDLKNLEGKKVKVKWKDGVTYEAKIIGVKENTNVLDGRNARYYEVEFENEGAEAEVKDVDCVFV